MLPSITAPPIAIDRVPVGGSIHHAGRGGAEDEIDGVSR